MEELERRRRVPTGMRSLRDQTLLRMLRCLEMEFGARKHLLDVFEKDKRFGVEGGEAKVCRRKQIWFVKKVSAAFIATSFDVSAA